MSFEHTAYTDKSRKAVNLVNKLRDAGAQFQLDLPCVVVCGNQSAGKSSLLERLCGVKLPRAAGTCTKCPTEVRLSTVQPEASDVSWCCQIKLRKEYDKNNKQLESRPTEEVFKTLYDSQKDVLHHYITAAQRALLNPESPADMFAKLADTLVAQSGGNDGHTSSSGRSSPAESEATTKDVLAFTRNVIVLEITGADVDLALIDLPGIIQTEQADDGTNVELVQQLVKQYISRQRTIIVATITCKDDIDNQQIVRLAREADREGSRTIGVLTKADTIEAETHDRWLPVMKNQQYPLRLGYFVVVNPNQNDLNNNITEEEAAGKEENFFKTDSWFSKQLATNSALKQRCGVDALRTQLSKQLVELTQKELPRMKEAIDATMVQVEKQLQALPPAPSCDATQELLTRMLALSAAVDTAVEGRGGMEFLRSLDALFWEFRSAVLAARFRVQLSSSKKRRRKATDDATSSTSTAAAGTSDGQQQQADQQQEEDVEFWLDGPTAAEDHEECAVPAAEHQQQLDGSKSSGNALDRQQDCGVITLERVRSLAAEYRSRELPGYTPYRVLEVLVEKHKGRWGEAAQHCLQQVAEQLNDLIQKLLLKHFGQFAAAQEHVRSLLFELQSELTADTQDRLQELMQMENHQIWTQNTHYFTEAKQAFNQQLMKRLYGSDSVISNTAQQPQQQPQQSQQQQRQGVTAEFGQPATPGQQAQANPSLALPAEVSQARALVALQAAGYDVTAADLSLLMAKKRQRAAEDAESMHSDEGLLDIIAGTLAYFKVSSKRVIDGVPMHIRHFLLNKYCKAVKQMCFDLPLQLSTGRLTVAAAGGKACDGRDSGRAAEGRAGDDGVTVTADLLMSEDRSIAEQRQQLMRQQMQLRDVKRILNSF